MIKVRVDGMMVIAALVVGGGLYIYSKRKELGNAVNPLSDQNLINQAVVGHFGQENVTNTADYIFAGLTLFSPMGWIMTDASEKKYAASVFGFYDPLNP